MMKKITIGLTIVALTTPIMLVNSAPDLPLRVVVNGQKVSFADAKPFIDENSRVQVPVRFVSEALGANVEWEGARSTASIKLGSKSINVVIGKKQYELEGQKKEMDTVALLKEKRTFVPVRFISEGLGATVLWDKDTKTVYVSTQKEGNSPVASVVSSPTPTTTPVATPTKTEWNAGSVDDQKEFKEIADMFRKVYDLEVKKDWDEVYKYLLPESLAKFGLTRKEDLYTDTFILTNRHQFAIEHEKVKKYEIRCKMKRINDTEIRVIYALFAMDYKTPTYAIFNDSRVVKKANGKWLIDVTPLSVTEEEYMRYGHGI